MLGNNILSGEVITNIIKAIGATEISLYSGAAAVNKWDASLQNAAPKFVCSIKCEWSAKDFKGACSYSRANGGETATEALKNSLKSFGEIVFTEEEEESDWDLKRGLRSAVKKAGLTTLSLQQIIDSL